MNLDKEIQKTERKLAALRAKSLKTAAHRKKTALSKVIAVVKRFGFDNIQQLLEIADTAAVATAKKRKRVKMTDALRKGVISLLKSGKTVKEVAKLTGVSTATANNIKSAAGLTKSKKIVKRSAPKKKKTVKKVKLPELASPSAPSTVT